MQDASKILLGSTGSSDRLSTKENGDPAVFAAGLAVRRDTDGNLSLTDGELIGVSLGESLSDTAKTSVCRSGDDVPIRLKDEGEFASIVKGDLTFTAVEKGVAGNSISITLEDDGTAGAETVEVTGTDIVVHMEGGVSTAQQIADAIEASLEASALIGVTIAGGQEATAQAAAVLDNLEGGLDSYPYVEIGQPVLIDSTTGEASSDGDASGAYYKSLQKDGVKMDGSEVGVAVIDMPGGL